MPVQMRPAQISFEALANLPDQFAAGQKWRQERDTDAARKDVFAQFQKGGVNNWGAMAQSLLARGDVDGATKVATIGKALQGDEPPASYREFQFAQQNPGYGDYLKDDKPTEAQRNAEFFSGLPENDPRKAYAPRTGSSLSVTEKKEVFDAEDDLANIDATVTTLNKALELNPQTMTGFGAGALATYGSKAPSWAVPDQMEGPARATNEWQTIMSMEAVKNMSQTLKGVTTDFELSKFEAILADPSTPRDVRERTIKRMVMLAKRKSQILKSRLEGVRGGTYFKPGGGDFSGGQSDSEAEADAQDGDVFENDNGERIMLRNGQWEPLQ